MIIADGGQALTAAAIAGVDFDHQDDWCEACRAYHVAATHKEDVPVECGSTGIWGGSAVADCNRAPHTGGDHITIHGTSWRD